MDGHVAVWRYQGIVRSGVHAMKYRFAYDVISEFVEHLASFKFQNAILVPIPLHKQRQNWRGFNQSSLLAKGISKKFNLTCVENALIRIENTTPQAHLGKEERMQNMRGKFAVNPDFALRITDYELLVLVDDVWTTGSTMKECAKVLK